MKTNPKESIFPSDQHGMPQFNYHTYGLSKREHFASLAMQGLAANSYWAGNVVEKLKRDDDEILIAKSAVEYADALIAELNKSEVKSETNSI